MPERLSDIIGKLQSGVGTVFPGAVLRISISGRVVLHEAVGRTAYSNDSPNVSLDTVYDVASLTKPILVGTLTMLSADSQGIQLDESVFLPRDGTWLEHERGPTLRALLGHRSGLPAWLPYGQQLHRDYPDIKPGSDQARELVRRWITDELGRLPASYYAHAPTYSDIGYIVLGWWLESRMGSSLEHLAERQLFTPWGLTTMAFAPTTDWECGKSPLSPITAATEYCPIRKRIIHGQVHDENAFALGGVAGHAGLFSTANDVGKWADLLLASYRGTGPIRPETIRLFWSESSSDPAPAVIEPRTITHNTDEFTLFQTTARSSAQNADSRSSENDKHQRVQALLPPTPNTAPAHGTWRLAWDSPSSTGSSGGNRVPQDAVCHLGFTGCSVWIAPSIDTTVVLLSNRVHPSRTNDRIKAFRPEIHDMIWDTARKLGRKASCSTD